MTHFYHVLLFRLLMILFANVITFSVASAQVNILAGYKPAYQQPVLLNKFISDFNTTLTNGATAMPNQHWLHGLHFGVRYKLNKTAFEVNYGNVFNSRVVRSRNINGELVRDKILNVQQASYGLGLAQYFGLFGVGATFDYVRMNTTFEDNGSGAAKFKLARDGFSSHFYIAFEGQNGGNAAISLRPYVQWIWSDMNLYPLANRLAPDVHNQPNTGDYNYRYPNFGIMLILCNGPQD